MQFKAGILLFSFCSCLSLSGIGQVKKSSWNNKDKGTVCINYSTIHVYPKDTSITGVSNSVLINISVRLYELTPEGCRQIEGKVMINGKEFKANDSTANPDIQSETKTKWASEGEYSFATSTSNEYYSVRTGKYFLSRGIAYRFDFYLVRKNAISRN